MYHYQGCGLSNVWLANGYRIENTPYGEAVTILGLTELHDAIATAIVNAPQPLSGAEFRFLRQELELSQEALALLLGCDRQSVARWEKEQGRKVDPASERLLRVLYRESKMGRQKLKPMLDLLQELENVASTEKKIVVRNQQASWLGKVQPIR